MISLWLFCNNQYGLISYTLKPFELEVSFKNRFGERVQEKCDYRVLYEILTYMVKQPYYCGEDQKEYFKKMMEGDREHRTPFYNAYIDRTTGLYKLYNTNIHERIEMAKKEKQAEAEKH